MFLLDLSQFLSVFNPSKLVRWYTQLITPRRVNIEHMKDATQQVTDKVQTSD